MNLLKNLTNLILLTFLVTAVISCKKDDDNNDNKEDTFRFTSFTLKVGNDEKTVDVIGGYFKGQVLNFEMTVVDKSAVDEIEWYRIIDGNEVYINSETFSGPEATHNVQITVNQEIGTEVKIKFIASNVMGKQISKEYDFMVVERPFAHTLQGEVFHFYSQKGNAFDLMEDYNFLRNPTNDEQTKYTDIITVEQQGIPFSGRFHSVNGTRYVKDNSYDFNNATVESAIEAFNNGLIGNGSGTNDPQPGDIFIVDVNRDNQDNKFMVLQINTNDPTYSNPGDNGRLTFTYKKN